MPALALVGWIGFGLLAIGARSILQYRRTGSTGIRGLGRTAGSIEWLGGALFLLATVAGVLAPLLELRGRLAPLPGLDARPAHAVGVLLYVVGLSGTLWAQLAMGASWRIGVDSSERTRLVCDGPFRWVRNPIFSAMIVCFTGLALLAPNIVAATSLVLLIGGLEIHVRAVEEPYLLRAHGPAYRSWAERTGRFFPGVGRTI